MIRAIYATVLFGCLTFSLNAQIGINQTDPNKHAALDINGGTTKGILIPVMNSDTRGRLKSNYQNVQEANEKLPDGLLIYDEGKKIFFFWNGTEWIALNPLQASDGSTSTSTLKLSNGTSSITFSDNVTVTGALTAAGNTKLQTAEIGSTLTVAGNTELQTAKINNTLTVTGALTANGGVNTGTVDATRVNVGTTEITSDKVKATTLEGYGVTPIGGIIMWSGKTPPPGWALCDGNITPEGYTTPDLRGRFIVGYNSGATDYLNPGNLSEKGTSSASIGGEEKVTLTESEMPSHTHTLITHGSSDDDKGGHNLSQTPSNGAPNFAMSGKVNSAGGNASHENRPPYYVLAFIMRIK